MPFKTILFILFLLNFVFSQNTGCKQYFLDDNGLMVDLSSLQGVVIKATNVYDSLLKTYFDYEFACGTIPDSKMANCKPYAQKPIASFCQEWNIPVPDACNLGVFSSVIVKENTLVISYKDGDKVVGYSRSVSLTITCDPLMNTVNLISVNNVMGTPNYVANATSKYACPLICNGHGKYTSSGCSCDLGYSGDYCTYILPIDPYVISLILNVVEGFVIVALVIFVVLLFRRLKSYTSMSTSSQINDSVL